MTNKNKGGRPSKLTPELREEIVSYIKGGEFIEIACATVGINKSTYYAWMRRGKESTRHTIYKKFYETVKQAQAWDEARNVTIISKHALTNWRAAAWKLERRHPERWGETKTKDDEINIKIMDEDNEIVNFSFNELEENKNNNKIKEIKMKIANIKNY